MFITLIEWVVGQPPTKAMAEVAVYGLGWGVVLIIVILPFLISFGLAIWAWKKWRYYR